MGKGLYKSMIIGSYASNAGHMWRVWVNSVTHRNDYPGLVKLSLTSTPLTILDWMSPYLWMTLDKMTVKSWFLFLSVLEAIWGDRLKPESLAWCVSNEYMMRFREVRCESSMEEGAVLILASCSCQGPHLGWHWRTSKSVLKSWGWGTAGPKHSGAWGIQIAASSCGLVAVRWWWLWSGVDSCRKEWGRIWGPCAAH